MDDSIIARLWPPLQRLAAVAVLLVAVLAVFSNIADPRQTDFVASWGAASLALHGHAAAAYDMAALALAEHRGAVFASRMPFGYPPAFLLVAAPFALLPYTLATAAWIGATAAAYLAAAHRLMRGAGWLAAGFAPVLVNVMIGQNGLLTAALAIAAAAALPRRPLLAGLFVGCLVIKPQLAILYPLAFAAGGQWRAVLGAAASALGLSLAALACFGPSSVAAFLHALPLFASVAAQGLVSWQKMASVYAALRLAGIGAGAAWAIHAAIALAAAAMVAIVWRGRHDAFAKMAVLVAASMLVSPYLYVYDTVALLLPFLWLAQRGADRRLLALLWLLPLISIAGNWGLAGAIDPMPLVPIGLLALAAIELRRGAAQ